MTNDALHKEAKRLLRLEASAKRKTSDYNSRRKEATAALRPVLTAIWQAFDRGEVVGGCTGAKEWCERVGTLTYRRARQIITGTSGNESKSKGEVTAPITVALTGMTIDVKGGYAYLCLELKRIERTETYKATVADKRSFLDYSEDKIGADGTAIWTHRVFDVQGDLSIHHEQEGATDQQLVAGLLDRFKAILQSMNLWDDGLKKGFEECVAETLERNADAIERRRRSAQQAAATRKRNAKPYKATTHYPGKENRTLCGRMGIWAKEGETPTCKVCANNPKYNNEVFVARFKEKQRNRAVENRQKFDEKYPTATEPSVKGTCNNCHKDSDVIDNRYGLCLLCKSTVRAQQQAAPEAFDERGNYIGLLCKSTEKTQKQVFPPEAFNEHGQFIGLPQEKKANASTP